MDQKRFIHSFIKKRIPFLIKGKYLMAGLNEIGLHDLGIAEKLSALQGVTE
jgi:hypothetical protein